MRLRGRKRTWLALWALAGGGTGSGSGWIGAQAEGTRGGWGGWIIGARAASVDGSDGRWAQSTALLTPSTSPVLLVLSGKTTVSGQTVTSTPSTDSSLSLSLSSPITDLANPPWEDLPSGPTAAYASFLPLSSSDGLFFGGDATGDAAFAVQTGNDSSWLLSLPSASTATDSSPAAWSYESAATWPSQPERRELAYTASATNGTFSRAWVYGGQRADGSGTTFAELWELSTPLSADGSVNAAEATWRQVETAGQAPPAMFDGTAVLVPSSTSGALPSIYLVGGVTSVSGTASAASLAEIYIFTPSPSVATGTWSSLSCSGSLPTGRRGAAAVHIGDGKIWIHGGRSSDGQTVYGDAAVLDTKRGRWTSVSEGEVGWGRSAQMVGETVVLAFGYGPSAPLSSALSIYAPSNDTWLNAYYPSYAVSGLISNPKAGSTASLSLNLPATSSATSGAGTDPTASLPASSAVDPSSPSTAPAPALPSGDSSAPSNNPASSPSDPAWTSPGAAASSPPSSSNPSGSNSSDGDKNDSNSNSNDSPTPSKGLIAGAVVGSLVGALVLVLGAGVAIKRHRDQNKFVYTSDGGDPDGGGVGEHEGEEGGGSAGLMAETWATSGGYKSSEMYNLGKALPTRPYPSSSETAGGGGMVSALVGFLSPRNGLAGSGGRKRRFDMFRDEESDVWNASLRSVGGGWTAAEKRRGGGGNGGWELFPDHDEQGEKEGEPKTPRAVEEMEGRGGLGVWDLPSSGEKGSSLSSSKSYLGGALGGFIGLAGGSSVPSASRGHDEQEDGRDQQQHSYAAVAPPQQYSAYADPALTPIAEWEEEDDYIGEEDDQTLDTHQTHSSGSHQTRSTYPSSNEVSPTKRPALAAASITRPWSPTPSLPGSSFSPITAATPVHPSISHALSQTLSRTSSGTSSLAATGILRSTPIARANSSWWSRLNKHHSDVSTPTAYEAIRDPAPAPSMGAIAETDPFADAASISSSSAPSPRYPSTRIAKPDEHGRFPIPPSSSGHGHLLRGEHDRSISSNASSEVTASSSVLEGRLRSMDVVQRIRTGSGGGSSVEVTPTLGLTDNGIFGTLPPSSPSTLAGNDEGENPFADSHRTPAADSVVWSGSTAGNAFSELGSPRPLTPQPRVPPLPVIQPPTPTYAPPTSPRKARLVGPRPLPPLSSPTSSSPFSPPPSSPRSVPRRSSSVRDLVAQIERKSSGTFDASGSLSPTLGGPPSQPPTPGKRKKGKVEVGLARKPVLYVANPDA
ncbi:hypothetical protein JCM11641_001855 [Rhodosporidiobolus odoratus]